MERRDYLKGQAALLRGVAATFDIPSIRNRLLALASECQILAQLVGKDLSERNARRSRASASPTGARRKRGSASR